MTDPAHLKILGNPRAVLIDTMLEESLAQRLDQRLEHQRGPHGIPSPLHHLPFFIARLSRDDFGFAP